MISEFGAADTPGVGPFPLAMIYMFKHDILFLAGDIYLHFRMQINWRAFMTCEC